MKSLALSIALVLAAIDPVAVSSAQTLTVVESPEASPREHLAARELQRYLYLRTGELAALSTEVPEAGGAVLVLRREDPRLSAWAGHAGWPPSRRCSRRSTG